MKQSSKNENKSMYSGDYCKYMLSKKIKYMNATMVDLMILCSFLIIKVLLYSNGNWLTINTNSINHDSPETDPLEFKFVYPDKDNIIK